MGGCAGSASAAAARARGAGGSAPELGHCGSGSPRLCCAPAWGAPRHRRRLCCFHWPVFPSSGSQGKAWGAGLDAGSCLIAAERVLDPAGRPRPSLGGQRQREGGLTGAGVEAVAASHLQPRWPAPDSAGQRRAAPSARSWGFPLAGAAQAKGRLVLRENETLSPTGLGERPAGAGRAGNVRSLSGLRSRPLAPASTGFPVARPHGAAPLFVSRARRARGPTRVSPGSWRAPTSAVEKRVGARQWEGHTGKLQVRYPSRTRSAAFGVGWGRGRALL